MFTLQAISMPPGNVLTQVWAAGDVVHFHLNDLTAVGTTLDPTAVILTWDFGDGTRIQSPVGTTEAGHVYASPGRYTLRVQVNADGALTEYSWQLVLSARWGDFCVSGEPRGVASLPAIHGFLQLPDGPRAYAVPLFSLATKDAASNPGSWGDAPGITWDADVLGRALHQMAWEWQQAYVTGFGRLPIPVAARETACWLHLPAESIGFGTSDFIQSGALFLELVWSKLVGGNTGTPAILAGPLDEMTAPLVSGGTLKVLTGMNLVGNVTVASAGTSVFAPDVQRAMEVADRSTPKTASSSAVEIKDLEVQRAREFAGHPPYAAPDVDWVSAWQWLAAQAASAAVNAFYAATGSPGLMANASVLVVANPASGTVTLRIVDKGSKFWACVSAVRTSDPSVPVTDDEVLNDLGDKAGRYVAVRADAAFTVPPWTGNLPRATWDVRSVTRALDAAARRTFQTSTGTGSPLIPDQNALGTKVEGMLLADGAEVSCAFDPAADVLGVARAIRPGVELVAPRAGDGQGLEPHARMWLARFGGATKREPPQPNCRVRVRSAVPKPHGSFGGNFTSDLLGNTGTWRQAFGVRVVGT